MAAVAMTDDVVSAGFISRRTVIEAFATPDFAPVLANETSEQVKALLFELGNRDVEPSSLAVVEQPLTARALSASADRAVVEVWSVLVVAAPGLGPGRQVWRTVTVDLELSDGRWLVDGWSSVLGPTPALAPESAVSDGRELAAVLAWPAAVGAA